MAQPSATIEGGAHPEAVRAATNAKNAEMNPPYTILGNANQSQPVKFYYYIFNVSDVEVKIERPWVSHNPAQGGKIIVVPAREANERVSKPYKIADIVQIPIRNDATKQIFTTGQTGRFLAQDAINPEDPQGDWKTVRTHKPGVSINEGTNLYHWGLFWTVNGEPTDEEINMAVQRLEANYNSLITEAKAFWAQGDRGKQQIGATHRRAANYFGLEFEWNQLYRMQKECPGCGSRISSNVAVCPHCPAVLDWQKAIDLGLRTTEQAIAAGVMEPEHAPKSKRAAKQD